MHPCTLAFLHGQRCLHDSAVVDMRWGFPEKQHRQAALERRCLL